MITRWWEGNFHHSSRFWKKKLSLNVVFYFHYSILNRHKETHPVSSMDKIILHNNVLNSFPQFILSSHDRFRVDSISICNSYNKLLSPAILGQATYKEVMKKNSINRAIAEILQILLVSQKLSIKSHSFHFYLKRTISEVVFQFKVTILISENVTSMVR